MREVSFCMVQKYYCKDFFINNEPVSAGFYMEHREKRIENTALSLLIYIIRLYERSLKNETAAATRKDVIDDTLMPHAVGLFLLSH